MGGLEIVQAFRVLRASVEDAGDEHNGNCGRQNDGGDDGMHEVAPAQVTIRHLRRRESGRCNRGGAPVADHGSPATDQRGDAGDPSPSCKKAGQDERSGKGQACISMRLHDQPILLPDPEQGGMTGSCG
jgi:hypothetical protein